MSARMKKKKKKNSRGYNIFYPQYRSHVRSTRDSDRVEQHTCTDIGRFCLTSDGSIVISRRLESRMLSIEST